LPPLLISVFFFWNLLQRTSFPPLLRAAQAIVAAFVIPTMLPTIMVFGITGAVIFGNLHLDLLCHGLCGKKDRFYALYGAFQSVSMIAMWAEPLIALRLLPRALWRPCIFRLLDSAGLSRLPRSRVVLVAPRETGEGRVDRSPGGRGKLSQNEKTPSLFGGMHKIDVRSGAVVSLSGGRRERGPGAGAGGGVCAGLGGDPARAGEESGEQGSKGRLR